METENSPSVGPQSWESLGHTNQTFSGHLLYSRNSTGPTLNTNGPLGQMDLPLVLMGHSVIACLPLVLVCALEWHGF